MMIYIVELVVKTIDFRETLVDLVDQSFLVFPCFQKDGIGGPFSDPFFEEAKPQNLAEKIAWCPVFLLAIDVPCYVAKMRSLQAPSPTACRLLQHIKTS